MGVIKPTFVPFLVFCELPLILQCCSASLTISEMNFWAAKDTKRTLPDENTSQVMITSHMINCYHTFENIGWGLHMIIMV